MNIKIVECLLHIRRILIMDGRNKDWYFRMEYAKYKAALTAWIVTIT